MRATADLVGVAAAMADTYREHLALEERDLFPVARTKLGAVDLEAISAEMDARRGRAPRRCRPPICRLPMLDELRSLAPVVTMVGGPITLASAK